MKEVTYYTFANTLQAQNAIDMLRNEGCKREDILVFSDDTSINIQGATVAAPKSAVADIATGLMVVGALGGLFELIMETKVFHAMEFGPATIYPLLGILIGIAAGMFLGALIGLYIYMGRPECGCRKQLAQNQLVLAVEKEKVKHLKKNSTLSYQV